MIIGSRSRIPVTEEDILEFESKVGSLVHETYRTFIKKYNGCRLEPNTFSVDRALGVGVSDFIPLSEIFQEKRYLDNTGKHVFPIANAEGGNYITINICNGSVYFWDHESPTSIHLLADNIETLVSRLVPFGVDDVEVDEHDIKNSWINPVFLKKIQDEDKN